MESVNKLGERRGDSPAVREAKAFLAEQGLTYYADPLNDGWSLKVARKKLWHKYGTGKVVLKAKAVSSTIRNWFIAHGWQPIEYKSRLRFHIRKGGRRTLKQTAEDMKDLDTMLERWGEELAVAKVNDPLRVRRVGIAEVKL